MAWPGGLPRWPNGDDAHAGSDHARDGSDHARDCGDDSPAQDRRVGPRPRPPRTRTGKIAAFREAGGSPARWTRK
jgi:hypothetical protein